MTTTTIGKQAEVAVADYLSKQGYGVLDRNWRTRLCEIDIIAKRTETIYFIEVKYRGGQAQGSGFDYIGPQKIKQMEFAAKMWIASNNWEGDYRILAAEVTGLKFDRVELVEVY